LTIRPKVDGIRPVMIETADDDAALGL